MFKRDIAIELTEGHQLSFNLEQITRPNSYFHFYFTPLNRNADINVFVHSLYGRVALTLSLWRQESGLHKSAWPFPGGVDNTTSAASGVVGFVS